MADSANEAESFLREMPLLTRLLTVSLTVPSVSGFKIFLRAIANFVQIVYVTHKKKILAFQIGAAATAKPKLIMSRKILRSFNLSSTGENVELKVPIRSVVLLSIAIISALIPWFKLWISTRELRIWKLQKAVGGSAIESYSKAVNFTLLHGLLRYNQLVKHIVRWFRQTSQ